MCHTWFVNCIMAISKKYIRKRLFCGGGGGGGGGGLIISLICWLCYKCIQFPRKKCHRYFTPYVVTVFSNSLLSINGTQILYVNK